MYKIFFLILICFSFDSCIVYNATKGKDCATCSIHDCEMSKGLTRTFYGMAYYYELKDEYANAKNRVDMGCSRPLVPKFYAKVYYCKKCDRLKRKN